MIRVEEVSKHYGNLLAVNRVSFHAQPGEVLGLLGPNGAGKTSLLRIISGYHYPSGGKASIVGVDVVSNPVQAKQRIGYLPEVVPLYPDFTVQEYLQFIASVRAIQQQQEALERVQNICGISEVWYRKIDELSKGYRQRVGLAQAIIHDPEVVILDEPTSGLDPNQIIEIRKAINELGKTKSVILSTHIMQEAEALCQRVLIMHKGNIVASGTSDEIRQVTQGGVLHHVTVNTLSESALQKLQNTEGISHVETLSSSEDEERSKPSALKVVGDTDSAQAIFHWAVKQKLVLLRLEPQRSTLEDIFVSLTGE